MQKQEDYTVSTTNRLALPLTFDSKAKMKIGIFVLLFNRVVTSKKIKSNTMAELKDLIDNRFTENKNYFE